MVGAGAGTVVGDGVGAGQGFEMVDGGVMVTWLRLM